MRKKVSNAVQKMKPGEYRKKARLVLNYGFARTPFGGVLVACTQKGVAYLAFADTRANAVESLASTFPGATLRQKRDARQRRALETFLQGKSGSTLHLKGTDFQLSVWKALLRIPRGQVATYADIARRIHRPAAHRAVGTAVGRNPVALLVPCHRVVPAGGTVGNYHWSGARKEAILRWEARTSTH